MCHYSLELVGMNKALNHTPFLYHYHPQRSGCNGESYDNACRAHSVGVSVSYMGYCAATTEPLPSDETIEDVVVEGWASNCRNNDQCPEDTKFCMLDMGNCTPAPRPPKSDYHCLFRQRFGTWLDGSWVRFLLPVG